MQKISMKFVAALAAAMSLPAMAQSGTSGSSGSSGSAGLGIDYGALVSAGASGNPGVATPRADEVLDTTMGGPLNGVRKHFARQRRPQNS